MAARVKKRTSRSQREGAPIDVPSATPPKPVDEDEQKRLRGMRAWFLDDFNAMRKWRDDKREYGRFYDGDQLSEEETRELKARGQPPVVINRIKPKLDAIFGIVQELAVETKAYPVGDRENECAEISEKFRSIENASHFNEEELQCFKEAAIDGVGYIETKRVWDGLESRLLSEFLPNQHVVVDKFCRRPDMKDAKRIHKHAWKDLDDTKTMFPKKREELDMAATAPEAWGKVLSDRLSQQRPDQYASRGGEHSVEEFLGMADLDSFVDRKRKRVRVVTTYWRSVFVRRFMTANGTTQDVTDQAEAELKRIKEGSPTAQEWTQNEMQLNSTTFCWNAILEEKRNIRPFDMGGKFPIERCLAYVTRDEDKPVPYGIVKQHIDPQKETNKRRSKMLHLLNVAQVWHEKGAFDACPDARQETLRPDGWVAYNPQFKVERITHENLATAQYQLLQEAKSEIDKSGINQEIEGRSVAQSGREFQLRLREGLKSIRELMNNLRAMRRRVAEFWLDEILADAKRDAEASGQEFTMTKYDVVIEEAPESVNLESETFQELSQLAQAGLPIPPNVLIQLSPIHPKYKKMILDQWAQAQGQGAPPPQIPQKAARK